MIEPDIQDAVEMAEEIQTLVDELPAGGEDFGASVSERAADIAANIEAHGRVTVRQYEALENMMAGN